MTENWAVQQVMGGYDFSDQGDVAEGQYAFVIDSGVDLISDLNVNTEWSRSFVADAGPHDSGRNNHGTKVASLIGAKANEEGFTGVAPGAQIVSLKALNYYGSGSLRNITLALEYARDVIVENDLFDKAVVNLSLGGNGVLDYPIIEEMADMGIKLTIAAGNSGQDVDGYRPAGYGHHPNVYTVTASTRGDEYANFTNYDGLDLNGIDDTDFTAPGAGVQVLDANGDIVTGGGTSFSAPLVAGLLLMSEKIKPGQTFNLTDDQVERGMIPDALATFDPYTYKHGERLAGPVPEGWYDLPPEAITPTAPEPIVIEVPVEVPGPVVEVPVYIDVPVEVPVEVPVYVPVPQDPPDVIIRGGMLVENNLQGTELDELILGGEKRDYLRGGAGDDVLMGFGGGDKIKGGKGDDLIDAGRGRSKLWGGEGEDTFVLREGRGFATLKDYDPTEDLLGFDAELEVDQKGDWFRILFEGDVLARYTLA